ncbi:MAG: hypothetical protein ABIH99_01090 [Candidatus Micrarchaeota archaeon]
MSLRLYPAFLLFFFLLLMLIPSFAFADSSAGDCDACEQEYSDCISVCEQDYGPDSPNRGDYVSQEMEIKCSGSLEKAYEEEGFCYEESGIQYEACYTQCDQNDQPCSAACFVIYNERNINICVPDYLNKCYSNCTLHCGDAKEICDGNCSTVKENIPCSVRIIRTYDGVSADGVSQITFTMEITGDYDNLDLNIVPQEGATLRGTITKPNPTTIIFKPDEADAQKNYLTPQTARVIAECTPVGGENKDKVTDEEEFTIEQPPLFFVHGFLSSSAVWALFEQRVKADEWEYDDISYPGTQDISLSSVQLAQELHEFIEQIKAGQHYGQKKISATKVDIISHSMGGLVTRSYVGGSYQGDIRKFVMIGTPNHGSWDAKILPTRVGGVAGAQLVPSSSFLTVLNAQPLNPEIEYHSIAGTGWITDAAFLKVSLEGDGIVLVESVALPGVPVYLTYDGHSSDIYWVATMGATAFANNGGGWTTSEGGTLTTSTAAYGITKSAILTGSASSVADYGSAGASAVQGTLKSPATLHAYGDGGEHVGLTADGELENELGDGVFYSNSSEYNHQIITIYGRENINFVVKGEGAGTFAFELRKFSEDGAVETTTFENIAVDADTQYSLNASSPSPELIKGMKEEEQGDGNESGESEGSKMCFCLPALLSLLMLSLLLSKTQYN